MGQRVGRGKRRQRQRCGNGLFQPPGIAKRSDETVVGLVVFSVCRDSFAKGLCRSGSVAGGEQVEAALGESFRVAFDGLGHGSL
jgi:hypothetical protein